MDTSTQPQCTVEGGAASEKLPHHGKKKICLELELKSGGDACCAMRVDDGPEQKSVAFGKAGTLAPWLANFSFWVSHPESSSLTIRATDGGKQLGVVSARQIEKTKKMSWHPRERTARRARRNRRAAGRARGSEPLEA